MRIFDGERYIEAEVVWDGRGPLTEDKGWERSGSHAALDQETFAHGDTMTKEQRAAQKRHREAMDARKDEHARRAGIRGICARCGKPHSQPRYKTCSICRENRQRVRDRKKYRNMGWQRDPETKDWTSCRATGALWREKMA